LLVVGAVVVIEGRESKVVAACDWAARNNANNQIITMVLNFIG
jgi:hypothetical protein